MISESLLDGMPLFQGLDPRARYEIAQRSVLVRRGRGERFWRAGDMPKGILCILEGRVRLLRGDEGRRQVIHAEGPGAILGEVPFFDGGGYPATAEAERSTQAVLITGDAIEAALKIDPSLAWTLLHSLARRVRELAGRLEMLATSDVRTRLARTLLEWADTTDGGGGPIMADRTQQALAEELGTVREVVVRNLAELRRSGLIDTTGRGRYQIVDRGALEVVAGLRAGPDGSDRRR